MVEPMGPRPMGPYSGINKVVPTKDREPKKKTPREEPRREEPLADEDEEGFRKGRQIDDHA